MLIGGWVGSALRDRTVPLEDLNAIKGQHCCLFFELLNVFLSLINVILTNGLHQKVFNIEKQLFILSAKTDNMEHVHY